MAGFGQNPGFTAITGVNGPSAAAFSSVFASINSAYGNGATTAVTSSTTDIVSEATSSPDPTSTLESTAISTTSQTTSDHSSTRPSDPPITPSRTATTFATSTASTDTSGSVAQSTVAGALVSTTDSNAASSATGGAVHKSDGCHSVSCSAGLQAAIAVPVVVAVLALIAIVFFCMRRRKKDTAAEEDPDIAVAAMAEKPKKRWSRHLRVFSFDAELLMGGRYSSSNSIRTGETRSVRSAVPSARGAVAASVASHEPSVTSFESVAPPYGVASAQADRRSNHSGLVALPRMSSQTDRPSTATTAPPPYVNNQPQSTRDTTRRVTTQIPIRNQNQTVSRVVAAPAAATAAAPLESPFNDPPEVQSSRSPLLNGHTRNSLSYHPPAVFVRPIHDTRNEEADSESDEEIGSPITATSSIPESTAVSIHEAQVGRSVSVTSGGRAYVAKGSRASQGSMSGSGSSSS